MKIFILLLPIIFILGCTNDPSVKSEVSYSHEVNNGQIETVETIQINDSKDWKLELTYSIYTHIKTKKSYCRNGFGNSSISIPLDYCLAIKEDVLSKINSTGLKQ